MEVAVLTTRLEAQIAAFQAQMAAAASILKDTKKVMRDLEKTTIELQATLNGLGVDARKMDTSIASLSKLGNQVDDLTKAFAVANKAAKDLSIPATQTAEDIAKLKAETAATNELADARRDAANAGRFRVFSTGLGRSIMGPTGRFMSPEQAAAAGFQQLALPAGGPVAPLGRQNILADPNLQSLRARGLGMPRTGTAQENLIPSMDLRVQEVLDQWAARKAHLAADKATQSFMSRMASNLAASGIGGALGGGGGGSMARRLGFGGGGGGGAFGRGPLGRIVGGLMGGMASFGSVLGLAGFGAERVLTTGAGLAGSLGGGILGGGLLGAGALGVGAVGMGTDLAGIGQAAGDIKSVSAALTNLQDAIKTYGRNSQEAATAQSQLNTVLGGFSKVAQSAVLAAAQTGQQFHTMFNAATGAAEKTGADIINQAMRVGEAFLPTIGKFAAQNMVIIQKQLQPFFTWLRNPGGQGGLGIFTDLEKIFQNNLPTAMHALTQAFEVFAKVIDISAQHTGGLTRTLNDFFTKWNDPSNFPRLQSGVNSMIGLFKVWVGLGAALGHTLYDLFRPSVGIGADIVMQLTNSLKQFNKFLSSSGMQKALSNLFGAHKQQLDAFFNLFNQLLPVLDQAIKAFIQMEAIVTKLTVGPINALAKLVRGINDIPFATTIIGWGLALLAARKAITALLGILGTTKLAFLGIGTAAKTGAVAVDEAQAAEMMALRKTGIQVEGLKASFMTMAGKIIPVAIALSLIPGNTGGQEVLQAAGIGFAGKLPIVGGLAQWLGLLGNKIRTTVGEPSLLPPSDKATFQQQYPIVGALMGKTGMGMGNISRLSGQGLSDVVKQLTAHGIPSALAQHYAQYITQQTTAQDFETWLYQHPGAYANFMQLSPAEREAATTMQTTTTAPQRAAVRQTIKGAAAAVKLVNPAAALQGFISKTFQKALALPASIQAMVKSSGAGLSSPDAANAAARNYYLRLLKISGLSKPERYAIEDQLALYPKPIAGAGSPAGSGFGGATSAGGSVFNAQQALSQAMTAGSGVSTAQQVSLAKQYLSATQKAYDTLLKTQVPASKQHAKQQQLTVLLRDESQARKDITTIMQRQASLNVQIADSAVTSAKASFDTAKSVGGSYRDLNAAANQYLAVLHRQQDVLEKQVKSGRDAVAAAKELKTISNDIKQVHIALAKAQEKIADESRRTQIAQHQTRISAIRSNLTSGVSAATTPGGALDVINRALLAASSIYAQLWMLNKKLLGQTDQTTKLKAEENQIRKEMNATLGIIHTAEKDQAKAHKAQTSAKINRHWEKVFGLGPGNTATVQSVQHEERNALLHIVRSLPHALARHVKGISSTTDSLGAIPGAAGMSINQLIKSLQVHGVHFSKNALKDFKEIREYLDTVAKKGIKFDPSIREKITGLLQQIEQNTRPSSLGFMNLNPVTSEQQILKNAGIHITGSRAQRARFMEQANEALGLRGHLHLGSGGALGIPLTLGGMPGMRHSHSARIAAHHDRQLQGIIGDAWKGIVPVVKAVGRAADWVVHNRVQERDNKEMSLDARLVARGHLPGGLAAWLSMNTYEHPYRGKEGAVADVTININGYNKDKAELAREIHKEILKSRRRNTTMLTGANAGRNLGAGLG